MVHWANERPSGHLVLLYPLIMSYYLHCCELATPTCYASLWQRECWKYRMTFVYCPTSLTSQSSLHCLWSLPLLDNWAFRRILRTLKMVTVSSHKNTNLSCSLSERLQHWAINGWQLALQWTEKNLPSSRHNSRALAHCCNRWSRSDGLVTGFVSRTSQSDASRSMMSQLV